MMMMAMMIKDYNNEKDIDDNDDEYDDEDEV